MERNPPTVLEVRPVPMRVCRCNWNCWCVILLPYLLLLCRPAHAHLHCGHARALPLSTQQCCPCRCRLKSQAGQWWAAGSVQLCRWATSLLRQPAALLHIWLHSWLQPCCLASSTAPCSFACSLRDTYLPSSNQCSVLLVQLAFADAETVRWQWFRSRLPHQEQPDAATEDHPGWELMQVSGRVYQVSAADLGQRLKVECTAGRAQEG